MTDVSACLIVKDDPRVVQALTSIRAHVDEIVVVDTGRSMDEWPTEEDQLYYEGLADKLQVFKECNFPDGDIADFSAARNRSFELATHDTVMWLDADDEVVGLEHLQDAIAWCEREAAGRPWRARFPYEYEYDEQGVCITMQSRERIVAPKAAFHWVRRVHEGLTAKQPTGWITIHPPFPIIWKHRAKGSESKEHNRRNLRILRDVAKLAPDDIDAKTAFDLGVAQYRNGDHLAAIHSLAWCADRSDWTEEKLLACMHLVELYSFYPGTERAEAWALRAVDTCPEWPDGYFALAKIAFSAAEKHGADERRQLERAAHYAAQGLACAEPDALGTRNPQDRARNIPWILHESLRRLGRLSEALCAIRLCTDDNPQVRLRQRDLEFETGERRATIDIAIVCGESPERFDPLTVATKGIGGSETAVIEVAKRLVTGGARVRIFCECENPGLYDEVEYHSMSDLAAVESCELLIAWRKATLLELLPARVKWLWCHDKEPNYYTKWAGQLADRVLVLSEWHKQHMAELFPELAFKLCVTRNGIDLTRFDVVVERDHKPHKAIWSCSPDRGLEWLLGIWPTIRARVTDAELHCFYGFVNFDPDDGRAVRIQALAATLTDEGVIMRGRVDQRTLAAEMLSAGVWLYPSWAYDRPFHETSCIGVMEAQAAGLRVVASGWGALLETVRVGHLILGDDVRTAEYETEFVEATVAAMTDGQDHLRALSQRAAREAFSWDGVAAEWSRWAVEDVREHPVASIRPERSDEPIVHMVLGPQGSGGLVMDVRAGLGDEAMGGGSRAGFVHLTRALARRGLRVRAFSTFADAYVEQDGVEWIRLDRLRAHGTPDVMFAFHDTSVLELAQPGVLRIGSHHSYQPYLHFQHTDVNTAPSEHAMRFLRDRFDPGTPWYVLPNGVPKMSVDRKPVPGRVLYHTSPERGLRLLLRVWPKIRASVSRATLHVVGPVEELIAAASAPSWRTSLADGLADAHLAGGIKLLGRLPRSEVLRELGEASIFAFPCSPPAPCETFSLSTMECCKLGVPVVLAPADALESIYGGTVRMTPSPVREHLDEFAAAVIDVLQDSDEQARLAETGRQLANKFTFEREAEVLDGIIRKHLRPKKEGYGASAELRQS